jgi:hypothetical protein
MSVFECQAKCNEHGARGMLKAGQAPALQQDHPLHLRTGMPWEEAVTFTSWMTTS